MRGESNLTNAKPLDKNRLSILTLPVSVFICVLGLGYLGVLRYQELSVVSVNSVASVGQLTFQDAEVLNRAGVSIQFYAAYFTAAELVLSIVSASVALVILSQNTFRWISTVTAGVLFGVTFISPIFSVLERDHQLSPVLLRVFRLAFGFLLVSLPLIFPDGRVIPRFARIFIAAWAVYILAALMNPDLSPAFEFGAGIGSPQILPTIWVTFSFLLGVVAQAYRYRRVSGAVERHQTKWVIWGFAVFLVLGGVGVLIQLRTFLRPESGLDLFGRMIGPSIIIIGALLIPVTIGVSILRYRLWDIDLIIRRTLIYSLVTASLALVYFGGVIILQQLFRSLTGAGGDLAIILSTLAIAALFNPLRHRIQDAIDRRFYRRKYDAQKVLARFAVTARDEVELDKLTGELVRVINETIQPSSASLWLRPIDRHQRGRTGE